MMTTFAYFEKISVPLMKIGLCTTYVKIRLDSRRVNTNTKGFDQLFNVTFY